MRSNNNELKINDLQKIIADLYLQKAQLNIQKLNTNNIIKEGVKNGTLKNNKSKEELINTRNSIYNDLRNTVTQIANKENELSKLEQTTDLKYIFENNSSKKSSKKSKTSKK